MNDTTNRIPVEHLTIGATDAQVHQVEDWSALLLDDDRAEFWEAFRHTDGDGRDWTLIACGSMVVGVLIDGTVYDRNAYDEYAENDTTGEEAIEEDDFEALFRVEPYEHAEGPMMGYWYDCYVVEDDPAAAAARIAHLPLCVVQVDGSWGLALTGGGMDLTWEIVAAYVALGTLPPYRYATDLPSMGGRGKSEEDQYLTAACLRTLHVTAERAGFAAAQLAERAARWAGDR